MKTTRISQVNVEAGRVACLPAHNPRTSAQPVSLLFALACALLLLLSAQLQSKAQSIVPEYIPLNAEQLDQLVAPIALDPDPLVAQILIGATFPDQVTDANNWILSNVRLTPEQRAAQASGMSWDPSVKGLVVFPLVLDSMAKNNAWTVQLGNAYFNQPDDVMSAIQALRQQAMQARVLVNVPQETVVVSEDLIEIQPADPTAVFVAYYNPWAVWGSLFAAYPGYAVEPAPAGVVVADGVSFEPAVSAGLDAHFGFSFGGWGLASDGGAVTYNNNVYNSNSRTVADRGHFGGHDCRAFEHGGRGVPAGFHPGHRGFDGRGPLGRPMPRRVSEPTNRRTGFGAHSMPANHNYNSGRVAPGIHSNPVSHSMQNGRPSSTGRFNNTNRSAVRNMPSAHTSVPSRNTMANHTTPSNRSVNGSHATNQRAAANHSLSPSRPAQGNMAANRPASRPAAPTHSMANRPAAPSNSFATNRPTSRPATGGNSFGGNRAMNRSAMKNNAGANHAMARPAAMNRPAGGGASFGGGHKH